MRMRERMARVQKKNNEKPCMSETAAKVDMPMILRTTRTERDEREGERERERERERAPVSVSLSSARSPPDSARRGKY